MRTTSLRRDTSTGGASRATVGQAVTAMLHILWSLLTGFFIGLLARALLPGANHMGVLATALLGIAGSFVGGLLGRLIRPPEEGAVFHPAGFFMSIVGAVVLLLAFRFAQ